MHVDDTVSVLRLNSGVFNSPALCDVPPRVWVTGVRHFDTTQWPHLQASKYPRRTKTPNIPPVNDNVLVTKTKQLFLANFDTTQVPNLVMQSFEFSLHLLRTG